MLTLDIAWHLIALVVASTALLAAGHRVGAALFDDVLIRVATAATVASTAAVGEALLLGTFGQGASPVWLTCAAVVTWAAARLTVPAASIRSATVVADAWRRTSLVSRGLIAGFAALGGLELWHFLLRPVVGADGLYYHLTEPEIWVMNGRPGSMHQIYAGLPLQAYPRTLEVLDTWVLGIARTTSAVELVGPAFVALAVIAMAGGLRVLHVRPRVAVLAAAAFVLTPMVFIQGNGYFSDLPAAAWLLTCAAFVVAARNVPHAGPLAIVAAGLAIGTKTTTGPLAVLLLLVALWWTRGSWARIWPSAAVGSLVAIGVGGIWAIANAVTYHAPLFPFSGAPGGRAVPRIITALGASFLSDPRQSLHAIGRHYLLTNLGGFVLVPLGVAVVLVMTLLDRRPRSWRVTVGGTVVVAALTLVWASSNFTGYVGISYLTVAGLRYLIPVCAAAVWLLALMSRTDGAQRVTAVLTLVGMVLVDAWEIWRLPAPFHPSILSCLACFVVGFAAAGLPRILSRRAPARITIGSTGLASCAAVGTAAFLLLTVVVGNNRFDTNHPSAVIEATGGSNTDAYLLPWFADQPSWQHGHGTVTMGPEILATLAGPRLTHPLGFLPYNASCQSVRAVASTGWLVVHPVLGSHYTGQSYEHAVSCLANIQPVHVAPDGWLVYAHRNFVSAGRPSDGRPRS